MHNFNDLYKNGETPFSLEYVSYLAKAITSVEMQYCQWRTITDNTQKIERVFAYELYHQLSMIARFDKFRLDGEILKMFKGELDKKQEKCSLTQNGLDLKLVQNRFTPDLVIHLAQNNYQQENQKVVIEIKTNRVGNQNNNASNKETAETILKLNHYLKTINFQYGVFITVSSEFEDICNQLRYLFSVPNDDGCINKFNRIIIMNYNRLNGRQKSLTIQTLLNILRKEQNYLMHI